MGNCGSSPAVKDDPPPRKPQPPSSRPPSQKESLSVPTSVPSSKSPLGQPADGPSSRSKESNNEPTSMARKSKSMEIVQMDRSMEGPGEKQGHAGKEEEEDDNEDGGEWKVRRRVSRRLSLEVQKRPGSKTGSPSPAWGAPPTPADQAAWEAASEADLMKSTAPAGSTSTESTTSAVPTGSSEDKSQPADGQHASRATSGMAGNVRGGMAEPAHPGVSGSDAILLQGSAGVLSTGRSLLGRESVGGALDGTDGDEGEGEAFWRVKRRGRQRRLSLEAEKPPDLAILAAIKRPSAAAPIAKKLVKEGLSKQILLGLSPNLAVDSRLSSAAISSSVSGRGSTESAVKSPATHSARVIDFAHNFDVADEVEDEKNGLDPPSSVKTAEILVKGSSGSPSTFRAKRRKSRRLSLEIERKPDEEILAAVRIAQSTLVTSDGLSYQPSSGEGEEEGEGEGKIKGVGELGSEPEYLAPAQSRTSSQEATAGAWMEGERKGESESESRIVDFGHSDDELSDTEESKGGPVLEQGKDYVRVNAKDTSRRRSMDVYKKAIASGESHASAATLAGLDPNILDYNNFADEEADLIISEESRGNRGENKDVSDVESFKDGTLQGQSGQSGFKSRWADYSEEDSSSSVTQEASEASQKFPDLSSFGNEAQPAPSRPSLAGISV